MLSFEEFSNKALNGESCYRPGVGVGYVAIKDEDDEEIFYAEWEYKGIETEDNEVTSSGWNEVERQDAIKLPISYARYKSEMRGRALKTFRADADMTQQALADTTGIDICQIQKWESGELDIGKTDAETVLKISKTFGITVDKIIDPD